MLALHADSGGLLHTREGPIERLEDLRGLRVRAPNALVASVLAELGAQPVVLAPLQIRAAAEAGRLDGAAMAWDVVLHSETAAIFRYHLDVPLYVSPLYFVMNRARYDGLDPALRESIDAASGPALAGRFGRWWEARARPAREAVQRRGNTVSFARAGRARALGARGTAGRGPVAPRAGGGRRVGGARNLRGGVGDGMTHPWPTTLRCATSPSTTAASPPSTACRSTCRAVSS